MRERGPARSFSEHARLRRRSSPGAPAPPRRGRATGSAVGSRVGSPGAVGRPRFAARGSARGRVPGPGHPGAAGLCRRGGVVPDHR